MTRDMFAKSRTAWVNGADHPSGTEAVSRGGNARTARSAPMANQAVCSPADRRGQKSSSTPCDGSPLVESLKYLVTTASHCPLTRR